MMYDKINRQVKAKKDFRLPALMVVCIGVAAMVIGIAVWAVVYHVQYQNFVSTLSQATYFSYENNCLKAEVDGQEIRVSSENAYQIYTYITVYGASKKQKLSLDEADCVRLDYGNGTVMKLWKTKGEKGQNRLYIELSGDDDYFYSYSTNEVDFEAIKVRYLTLKDNELW